MINDLPVSKYTLFYCLNFGGNYIEVTNSLITQRLPRSIHAATAAGFEMKVVLFLIATMITLIVT